ncbi:family 78 glycoside hydrolase catalytic domain [Pontiellaceae bacterium B1224]|nr:family 78 glycoside hydrolase catalytic domain [Pontiellaceae bacterium B1224]
MMTNQINPILRYLLCISWLTGIAFAAPTQLVDETPVSMVQVEDGTYLVDFGRVAFGNLRLVSPNDATVTVHFGEAFKDGRIDRKPPGTVRYKAAETVLEKGRPAVAAPEKDRRNTNYDHKPPAIRLPEEWGVILPFRWVEIEGWNGELKPEQVVRQSAYASTWDDEAASFQCSDEMLNQIWELCRYSIKATTFAGVYVDGDRERIPYEADSYLNQLSHYYSDTDKQMARDTIDYLMVYRTWPSEWPPHMVFMIHADWMHTGETVMVEKHYEALKSKILTERKGDDGLIATNAKQIKKGDIVDWPKDERDGYVFTSRNTVVNAFHLRALELMAELARALGKDDEAQAFDADYRESLATFQSAFFDMDEGLYKDGVETEHHSLHANLFPLAFGLVPEESRAGMAEWLANRGMQCSVYAAQYLMEGLFENGEAEQAVELMTAPNDRSWRHMVESGTTITWEAWDQKYKPNQDWNHAWGAAPANLLPRYILGVEPFSAGWETVRIRPHLGGLTSAEGQVPTPRGPIFVGWNLSESFSLLLTVPKGMKARVELPMLGTASTVTCDGAAIPAQAVGARWVVELDGPTSVLFTVETKKVN